MLRPFMLWMILPPVLIYLGLCGFMYARQRELIYFPQTTLAAAEETDLEIANDGVTLRGWVVNPGRSRVLLYFGGNAEAVQLNRESFADWFPQHTVYLVAYRGFGASEGAPSEEALFGDALALYDHAQSRHPAADIDVIGRSLGSGVASHVAARRPVRRLVLVTPFDSLAGVGQTHYPWLPVSWIAKDRFDSVQHLIDYRLPVLVIRAGQDQVIPATSTQRLIDALPHPPLVVDIPAADHSNVGSDPMYARALMDFVAPPKPL